MLRLVGREPTPCWPWRLRRLSDSDGHPIGAWCACGREVAQPRQFARSEPACLYCALDSGLLPEIEIEPTDERSLHAIATEARRAETVEQGSVHEGAGPKDIAQ